MNYISNKMTSSKIINVNNFIKNFIKKNSINFVN